MFIIKECFLFGNIVKYMEIMVVINKISDFMDRCVTGISDLDVILDGGIPKGNMILVAGSVGTGKTTLSTEFLIHGTERNENGLFISVTETTKKLISNLDHYEFFDSNAIKNQNLTFIDAASIYELLGLKKGDLTLEEIYFLVKAIIEIVDEKNIKRLVIDSITSISFRFRNEEKIRNFMLLLAKQLSERGCTSIMVSEIPPNEKKYSSYGVEEAISDGIILLNNMERGGDLLRTLQVVKMRGSSHSRAKYVMDLTPIGILIVPLLRGGL